MAPVRPVLKRRVKVPASTARSERSIGAKRAGRSPGWTPTRIMPATFAVQPPGGALDSRRDLHRFRVGPGPGDRRDARDRDRPAPGQLRDRQLPGRHRAVDGGLLGSDGRARCAVSRPRPPRRRASSRTPTRRPSPAGADAIVSIHVAGTLSGTIKSAQIARDMLPDREIHVVDSLGASMAEGILALDGRRARRGGPVRGRDRRDPRGARAGHGHVRGPRHARVPAQGRPDQRRPGGDRDAARRSSRSSSSSTVSSRQGDRVRTRAKARERLIEMICERPVERLAILHTVSADVDDLPRRGPLARVADAPRPGRRPDRAGRAVGRSPPRAGLRRRRGLDRAAPDVPLRRGRSAPSSGCEKVAFGLPTGTFGRCPQGSRGYTRATDESRARRQRWSHSGLTGRPVRSSGRRPARDAAVTDRPTERNSCG